MTTRNFDWHFQWMKLSSRLAGGPSLDSTLTGSPRDFIAQGLSSSHHAFHILGFLSLALLGMLLMVVPTTDVMPPQAFGRHVAHSSDGALIVPVIPVDRPDLEAYPVHVPYLQNPGPRDGRVDFMLVHGMDHDSDVWWPLAQRLLSRHPERVHRVYMIDLPAHGSSGWRSDRAFGQVGLQDYVDALRAAVAAIRSHDAADPGDLILAGHSMGGMVVQMLQARLLDEGGSLRETFGIDRVMLFAPTMPDALPFQTVRNLPVIAKLAHMFGYSRESSMVIEEPDDARWSSVFFARNSDGKPYGPMPASTEVHLMNNAEPGQAGLELMGFDWNLTRPVIPAGEFATKRCADTGRPCYSLVSVGFDEDQYVRPQEVERLHQYLTGSSEPCGRSCATDGACVVAHGPHDGVWSALESPSEAAALDRAFDYALGTINGAAERTGKAS